MRKTIQETLLEGILDRFKSWTHDEIRSETYNHPGVMSGDQAHSMAEMKVNALIQKHLGKGWTRQRVQAAGPGFETLYAHTTNGSTMRIHSYPRPGASGAGRWQTEFSIGTQKRK